jgi:hypothetical protein
VIDTDLLAQLLNTARDLTEPGAVNSEYVRGQMNLICDVAGLPSDDYGDLIGGAIAYRVTTQDAIAQVAWLNAAEAVTASQTPSAAQLADLTETAAGALHHAVSSGTLAAAEAARVAGSLRAALGHIAAALSPAVSDALPSSARNLDMAAARAGTAAHLMSLTEPAARGPAPAAAQPGAFPYPVRPSRPGQDGVTSGKSGPRARPATSQPPAPAPGRTP